jgi:hypothetical protein
VDDGFFHETEPSRLEAETPIDRDAIMTQNSIMVLKPYKWEGMWVFDDDKTGLVREAFVASVPEFLEALLVKQGIPL